MRRQYVGPTVFDCNDCAQYWFAADVAYALRDLYDDRIERIDLGDPRLRAFAAGYRAVRPLPDRNLRLLPCSCEHTVCIGSPACSGRSRRVRCPESRPGPPSCGQPSWAR